MNLNETKLVGRVTRQPEVKALPSGTMVCNFSVATNRVWKDKDGQKQEETEFHNVIAFGKTAETIGKYVVKGQELYVSGRLQTRSWESDGKKMYRTEVICEQFQFGAKPKDGGERSAEQTANDQYDGTDSQEEDLDPSDIPF